MEEKLPATDRIPLLDELRGLSIVLMVLYHAAYDLTLFGIALPIFDSPLLRLFLQPLFAGLFIFISGIACRYSRGNFRRGAKTFACAVLVTFVTMLVMPSSPDLFGILHLLGISMGIFALCARAFDRIPPAGGMALFFALFLLAYGIPAGRLGIGAFSVPLPSMLYTAYPMFFLGFPIKGFTSADYFPLLPWTLLFLSGSFAGTLSRRGCLPGWYYKSYCRPLAGVGRHTLIIYLLHQPLLFLLIGAAERMIGGFK